MLSANVSYIRLEEPYVCLCFTERLLTHSTKYTGFSLWCRQKAGFSLGQDSCGFSLGSRDYAWVREMRWRNSTSYKKVSSGNKSGALISTAVCFDRKTSWLLWFSWRRALLITHTLRDLLSEAQTVRHLASLAGTNRQQFTKKLSFSRHNI